MVQIFYDIFFNYLHKLKDILPTCQAPFFNLVWYPLWVHTTRDYFSVSDTLGVCRFLPKVILDRMMKWLEVKSVCFTSFHFFNCFKIMKALTLPILNKKFISSLGKTAIEFQYSGQIQSVFADGDQTASNAVLVNVVVNEVGDSFVASSDSKTMDKDGKTPIFKKGAVVVRQKQSMEFKSFTGEGAPAQFAQAAGAFGLQLNVVMAA